jgi:hypothetical protein
LSLPASPPFTVPDDIGPFGRVALRRSLLLELYESNEADFVDCAGVLYGVVASLNPGNFSSAKIDGYSIFCDFFTTALLAAPTQTNRPSLDEFGILVNVFGTAIAHTVVPKINIQDLYGPDGGTKNSVGWSLCLDLVRLVVIEAFKKGIHLWTPDSVDLAAKRLSGLRNGSRQLQMVEGGRPYGRAL